MNASKAKRRWMKWCRYVANTKTQANPYRKWGTYPHDGQSKAYVDAMFAARYAGRAYPRGARHVYYPEWAING